MITLLNGNLYQWDTSRVIQITPSDEEYPIHEVHFTTEKITTAYSVETYVEEGITYCTIPDILLQQSNNIICYEVRKNAKGGEETVSSTTLKVTKRNKPEDYVYTEVELASYNKLEARIQTLEDNADETAENITTAQTAANEAKTAAATAQSTAEAAKVSDDHINELITNMILTTVEVESNETASFVFDRSSGNAIDTYPIDTIDEYYGFGCYTYYKIGSIDMTLDEWIWAADNVDNAFSNFSCYGLDAEGFSDGGTPKLSNAIATDHYIGAYFAATTYTPDMYFAIIMPTKNVANVYVTYEYNSEQTTRWCIDHFDYIKHSTTTEYRIKSELIPS